MTTVQPCTAPQRRADQAAALRNPLREEIVMACRSRAYTISQLALALASPRDTINRQVHRLLDLGLLTVEAPSRHGGRIVTPYRASVQGIALTSRC